MPPHARKILAGLILVAGVHAAAAQLQAIERARDTWVACLKGTGLALALIHRAEPAETIVNATFGKCAPQENAIEKAMLAQRWRLTLVDETIATLKTIARDQILVMVLEVRTRP